MPTYNVCHLDMYPWMVWYVLRHTMLGRRERSVPRVLIFLRPMILLGTVRHRDGLKSDGCVRYASCGHAGNPPVYCGAHKTIGMVNLIGRRCAVDACEVRHCTLL